MGEFDDYDRLRLARDAEAVRRLEPGGPAAFVGQVTTAAPQVGKFLMVKPMRLLGPADEGGPAWYNEIGTEEIPVYLIGPGVPQTGDYLMVRHVQDRWVAERPTTTPSTGLCCSATGGIPTSIGVTFVPEVYTGPPNIYDFSQFFPVGGMVFGAVPDGQPPTVLSPEMWFSGNLSPGSIHQPLFQQILTAFCRSNPAGTQGILNLGYIYKVLALDGVTYVWATGGGGSPATNGLIFEIGQYFFPLDTRNTCSPFLMSVIDFLPSTLAFFDNSIDPGFPVTVYPQFILS